MVLRQIETDAPLNWVFKILRASIYIGLFIAWGVSIHRRIVQPQVSRYLIAISALMVFWITYKRVVKKCGFRFIEWRKLRTTYATILSQYHVSMKAISTSLGHYSSDFTKAIYVKSKIKVVNLASMI